MTPPAVSRPFRDGFSVRGKNARGFTLMELLLVLAIISIISAITFASIAGLRGSRDLSKAAYDIQGVLEQARTTAMASSTYTWVGFFEETPGTPGVAGTGQVVVSVVASADGTRLYSLSSPPATLPGASLTQIAKLLRMPNTHLDVLDNSATSSYQANLTRPALAATKYRVADAGFASTPTFQYPLTGTAQYTFTRIIQFNPQGDATRIGDNPTQLIEIGLGPTSGSTITPKNASKNTNVAAVQIAGIGGHVTTYRP